MERRSKRARARAPASESLSPAGVGPAGQVASGRSRSAASASVLVGLAGSAASGLSVSSPVAGAVVPGPPSSGVAPSSASASWSPAGALLPAGAVASQACLPLEGFGFLADVEYRIMDSDDEDAELQLELRKSAGSADAILEESPKSVDDAQVWDQFWGVVRSLGNPNHHAQADFLVALGLPRGGDSRSLDGAPPRAVLKAMQQAKASGKNIGALADAVAQRRFLCKVVRSTCLTYASHLRMIAWASELFEELPLGCSSQHIRRVATVCASASTLRGWLSAWLLAHQIAGFIWQGDQDPILQGIRKGTFKHQVPRLPRKRIDRIMVLKLLRLAVTQGRIWWSTLLVITYDFLLRMPSELFQQYRSDLLREHNGRFCYGPIRRKQRQDWCVVVAFCMCSVDRALCLHAWLPVLKELESAPGFTRLAVCVSNRGRKSCARSCVKLGCLIHSNGMGMMFVVAPRPTSLQRRGWRPCCHAVAGAAQLRQGHTCLVTRSMLAFWRKV